MDIKYFRKIGKMNLTTSIIFLVIALFTLALTIWFTIEIASSHLFGITENQEENNVGLAFGIIFIVLIFVMADFIFGILTIIFLATGIPLLITSISLLKVNEVTSVDIIVKKLKRTRVAIIISIVVGFILAVGETLSIISLIFDSETFHFMDIILPLIIVGLGVFLIIFGFKENKKLGEVINQITLPSKTIDQI